MREKREKRESGEIVIESTFVITISIFLLLTLLSMGMYLYHRAVVRVVAQQAAADMAITYPMLKKEPYYNYTNYYDFTDMHPYREVIWASRYKKVNTIKTKGYAYGLLDKYSMRENEYKDARIDVEVRKINFTSKEICVTVTDEYVMPFSGSLLSFAGLPEKVEITASASSHVVDMVDTMALWKFVITVEGKVVDTLTGKWIPAITKWLKFANRLMHPGSPGAEEYNAGAGGTGDSGDEGEGGSGGAHSAGGGIHDGAAGGGGGGGGGGSW